MLTVLHMCPAADWERVPESGDYAPESLAREGFVHCSDRGTAHLPANRLFRGRTDILLLEIDTAGLDVRWEPPLPPETAHGPWFPHVYGPVPHGSVVAVYRFLPGPDGMFDAPGTLTFVDP